MESDGGGVSDGELEARLLLSQTEQSAGRVPEAVQTLQPVVQRPLSSDWKVRMHFQIAPLHHRRLEFPTSPDNPIMALPGRALGGAQGAGRRQEPP